MSMGVKTPPTLHGGVTRDLRSFSPLRSLLSHLGSAADAATSSPSAKTNEELMLENESLRASLDALAKHAHALELANKAVTERAEERDKVVRSVVYGVRKEVSKSMLTCFC